MDLILHTGRVISRPTAEQLTQALREAAADPDGFAVLELNKQAYVQCIFTEAGGYMEYRLGSADAHFASRTSSLPLETITQAMYRFAARDPHWHDAVQWQKLDRRAPAYQRAPVQREKLIERKGSAIIISRKWTMRVAGLLLIAVSLLSFAGGVSSLHMSLRWGGGLLGTGVMLLVMATPSEGQRRGYRF